MKARARGESALLLLDVLQVVRAKNVKYAVIGAMAAAVHGVVRASLDADAILSLAAHEAPALARDVATAGFDVEVKKGAADDPIAAVLIIRDRFKNRVDLLLGLAGFDHDAFDRAMSIDMSGESLQVVSREDFIAMKLYAGGPVDVRDAQQAYYVNRDMLDLDLLRTLAKRYGKEEARLLEAIIAELGAI